MKTQTLFPVLALPALVCSFLLSSSSSSAASLLPDSSYEKTQFSPQLFLDARNRHPLEKSSTIPVATWEMNLPITSVQPPSSVSQPAQSLAQKNTRQSPASVATSANFYQQTVKEYTEEIINNVTNILQGDSALALPGTPKIGVSLRSEALLNDDIQNIVLAHLPGDVSLLGQSISGSELKDNAVHLGEQTSGNYQKGTEAGNGIQIDDGSGEGTIPEVALGSLTSDWLQSGTGDIVLNSTSSEVKILDTNGSYYATLDAGSLSADTTFTLSGSSGTILTSSNYGTYIVGGGSGLQPTNNLSDLANTAAARTNLGLGTIATQNTNAVSITGGNITGITDLAIIDGGTGISTIPSNGQILIGNGSAYTVTNITGGSGLGVTNGSGTLSLSNLGVTSLNLETGSLTLAGSGIASVLASSGTLTIAATEADTLSSITGRGSNTNTSVSFGALSTTGTTTLGNGSGTVEIASTGLDVSTAGALSGITGYTQNSGTFGISGSGTLSTGTGTVSLNGDTSIAAGKDLVLAAGNGNLQQTYSHTTGTAASFSVTNSGNSGTNVVKALEVNLAGTSGGTNTVSGIEFGNVTPVGSNTFNALTFGTGLTNFLATPTIDISAAGTITGATGLTLTSGNIDQSASAGTLSTGTGVISLNGDTTVASGKTLAITSADALTVAGKKVPQRLFITVPLAAALLTQPVFVADRDYKLASIKCSYPIASISGALQVTADSGSTAAGTGTSQLSGTIDLAGSVNSTKTGTLIGSPTTVSSGDRLSVLLTGTLTGLLGTCTLGLDLQ